MVKLFEYNEKVYKSAITMLTETGNAPIVHQGSGNLSLDLNIVMIPFIVMSWLHTFFDTQFEKW